MPIPLLETVPAPNPSWTLRHSVRSCIRTGRLDGSHLAISSRTRLKNRHGAGMNRTARPSTRVTTDEVTATFAGARLSTEERRLGDACGCPCRYGWWREYSQQHYRQSLITEH